MASIINDITVTSIETITAFDITTGAYKFTLDELQNATIGNTEEKVDITGKAGRKLTSMKRNKAATISATNGLLSAGLLEVQTGGTITDGAVEVLWTDYLTVNSTDGGAKTSYKAVGTAGSEIDALYVRNEDGTLGDKLTQAASIAQGDTSKFAYAPATKLLTFSSDITNGTEIVVYYKRKISAPYLENRSDVYSSKATLYVDAIGEDKCGNVFRIQFYIPKADISGEFSIEFGDNQTVHAFEAESLAGACGSNTEGNLLWTFTIFAENTADYVGA